MESIDEHISALTEDPGPVRPDADVAGAVREALELLTEARDAVLAWLNTGIHSLG